MSRSVKAIFTLSLLALNLSMNAQDSADPVLLEIDDRKVHLSEFEAVYKKNNTSTNQQTPEEYLDLYINFRLKVQDAEDRGMDTLPKFTRELEGYRRQLAEPYLSDNEVTEELMREAYDRLNYEVKASHLMISVGMRALPKDSLAAYNKIMAIKMRLEKGEDFETVAREVSEDPSVKDNNGDLGYFTALRMVYPFETAVYTTEPGKIAGPVRTQYGYHLIKVYDKRKARGEITTAHIMTRLPQNASPADVEAARMKINEIYDKLKEGGNFEELAAQFSDDKSTANKGGVLPPFNVGRMVESYEEAAFALENDGDFSKPVQTPYGFHIIKRIKLKPLGSYEELAPMIKREVAKDSRSRKSKMAFINRVKKENNFKEYISARNDFHKAIDTTYFQAENWTAENLAKMKKKMFTLGDSTATQQDFAKYLEKVRTRRVPGNIIGWLDRNYDEFKNEYITEYENVQLEEKYPEFRLLMQEYHDGILLFDLTDEMVWSKAVKDSAGLAEYYKAHKDEYMWGNRLEAAVFNAKDEETAKEVRKMLKKKEKKGYTYQGILNEINKDSKLNLEIDLNRFSKGENEIIDQIEWKKGISGNIKKDNRIYFVEVNALLDPEPKDLSEVRGLMTSAYQKQLEEEWIKELKAKYNVTVHPEHLEKIKK